MVRRIGNLWETLISPENFALAYERAIKHKKSKRAVKKFELNRAENLEAVRQLVASKKFRTARYHEKQIYEPKPRLIYILPFNPDRIVQHALMNVLIPIWEKRFIEESYACRTGRGMHSGSRKTMEFVRRNKYCLKCDISKFYPSINHDVLMGMIARKVKDPDVMWLVENIVRSFPGGKNAPIGNFCSQWFGNLYLNELDHFVKSELKIRDYVRYCDDFCLYHDDKRVLASAAARLRDYLSSSLKLTFSKCDLFPVRHGVDFLGYRHFDNYILLRKSTAKRVMRRLDRLPEMFARGRITFSHYQSSVGSTKGWLQWANTFNLKIRIRLEEVLRSLREIKNGFKSARAQEIL
ncbi:MAG: reverse transcriptase/maturase family protein [Rickettsiales bacterium]|jgi:retron-type reverse transcriptase|nr:reverse transcriptase/maturase family protein [Rickettsiales bacterium]